MVKVLGGSLSGGTNIHSCAAAEKRLSFYLVESSFPKSIAAPSRIQISN